MLADCHDTSPAFGEALDSRFDVVVIDGTWSQATKLHNRLMEDLVREPAPSEEMKVIVESEPYQGPQATHPWRHVCLSDDAVSELHEAAIERRSEVNPSGSFGVQLRRHPIAWKEVL